MAIKQPEDKSHFILPDLGEGVHEAELIKWRVEPGESVDEHQTIAEMETDKALVEVPSPWSGVIKELHGNPGDILNVGNPLVSYDIGGAAPAESPAPATSAAGEREDSGTVVGTMSGELTVPSAFARRATEPTAADTNGRKALATPAVRRLAREMGADIDLVGGSGRGGRVTASDVHDFVNGGGVAISSGPRRAPGAGARTVPSTPAPTIDADGTSERIPFRGVRRTIAQALDQSVRTAVHFTVVDEVDVTELDRKRREYSSVIGRKLSFLPFVMSAACQALRIHKSLNAIVDDANSEILLKGVVNLGCAVDTDHGLMVPVIEGAEHLSVVELGDQVKALAVGCRNRTIPRARLVGGTFTIPSVGSYGGMFATPIINYPEVAILA
ncbi:MAG: dihydrolipoamide acetyltransferase family protein, partial [Planctomycetota bacterium]